MKQLDREISGLEGTLETLRNEHDRKSKQRAEQLAQARKDSITAEVKYKLLEQQLAARRQRRQAEIDATAERLARLRDIPTPPASDARRLAEIERKLDELLREVKELRQELRK